MRSTRLQSAYFSFTNFSIKIDNNNNNHDDGGDDDDDDDDDDDGDGDGDDGDGDDDDDGVDGVNDDDNNDDDEDDDDDDALTKCIINNVTLPSQPQSLPDVLFMQHLLQVVPGMVSRRLYRRNPRQVQLTKNTNRLLCADLPTNSGGQSQASFAWTKHPV
eukprot:5115141-Amphidinium_carterae.1